MNIPGNPPSFASTPLPTSTPPPSSTPTSGAVPPSGTGPTSGAMPVAPSLMGTGMGSPGMGMINPALNADSQQWHAVGCASQYRSSMKNDPLANTPPAVVKILTDEQKADINNGKGLSSHPLTHQQSKKITAAYRKSGGHWKKKPLDAQNATLFNAFFFHEELQMLKDKGNLGELMHALKCEDPLRYQALVSFMFQLLQAAHERAMMQINAIAK